MTETFNFDFFQIPQTGPAEVEQVKDAAGVVIRRPSDEKISMFGALTVGSRLSFDYTRVNTMTFKSKGESEDVSTLAADTGVGQNVSLRSSYVNHNPLVSGSTVKYVRDDQFLRMTMSKEDGSSIGTPKFDIMDTKVATAEGIIATSNAEIKNWPSEGWYSFGKKHDFVQNQAR